MICSAQKCNWLRGNVGCHVFKNRQRIMMLVYITGVPNLLYVWTAYRITQVTRNRNIKIQKHEFICNLRFCDIVILFGTTCKSNTVRHVSYHSTILQYFCTCNRNKKNKYILFRKAQRAACKGSKAACRSRAAVWPPLVYNVLKLDFQANLCEAFGEDKKQHYCGDLVLGWGVWQKTVFNH